MFFDRKKPLQRVDYIFILLIFALLTYGFIILRSATLSYGTVKSAGYMRSQLISTLLGLIAMFILMFTPPGFIRKFDYLIYALGIGLLIYTLVGPNTTSQYGARSWIRIGSGFAFQPSEFVKIMLMISLASFMDKKKEQLNEPFTLIALIIAALIPVGLILLQPDNGTAIVLLGIIAVMFFIGGIGLNYIFLAIGILAMIIPVFWMKLDNYAKKRFFTFLNPEADPTGAGMQVYWGRISIGSGELFGRGLFGGLMNKNNYIPLKHSDFIFTVIGEELGLVGGVILFSLYFLLLYRMIKIAKGADYYSRVLISGILAMFLIHIWENIGMTMNLMPVTGIPLPFISHGGTFQIANLICMGLILGIKYYSKVNVDVPGRQLNNLLK